ncbi:MAG: prepilin peptidase [Glycocaulis sp.]
MLIIAASLLLIAALLALSIIDVRHLRLPDMLTLPLTGAGLIVTALLGWPFTDHLIGAVAGFTFFAGLTYTYRLTTGRTVLGLGDAKLLAAGGAWCGWFMLPLIVALASLSGLAFAAASTVLTRRPFSRRTLIPFGPFLAVGIFLAWLVLIGVEGDVAGFRRLLLYRDLQ